ncbi:DMT family transporter [Elizabethkingia sp. JS20170427COW]|uniref:EamA family transporter n=1 Tax=Elizabethkingia sp. JS20170427COW TaxID=2583851 RepID=UPI001110C605|nr:EamA family transporter [Elizabethkingia sp. JS20170427COW]QCX53709.1 EamA/RhaT family transporter [Elizabethkingia sp. JS20170427COW]
MLKNKSENLNLGILYVIAGASSYGMLATIVKTAYKKGFSTAEVTIAQYVIGILCLLLLTSLSKRKVKLLPNERMQLLLAGVSFGLTSVLYYISISFINASIAVVLLMQSVWIGVVIEAIKTKTFPNLKKIIAVIMVLLGTLLATNALASGMGNLDVRGLIFGFLAAISFSLVLFSTNSVATHLPPAKRSLYMLYGGSFVVVVLSLLTQILPYYLGIQLVPDSFVSAKALDLSLLLNWGIPIALFGTVIPPLMFNKGFPLTGIGLGSILSAFELPVSIAVAFLMLGEIINPTQWLGVVIILTAIVLLNVNFKKKLAH